jgi:hypothetical protein
VTGKRGSQFGSAIVASLPSVSPARIAVIGRQNALWYLASKHAIRASARTTVTIAMNRDASAMSSWWSRMNFRKLACSCWSGGSAQKRAASVCSGVRVVLVREPISLTSL